MLVLFVRLSVFDLCLGVYVESRESWACSDFFLRPILLSKPCSLQFMLDYASSMQCNFALATTKCLQIVRVVSLRCEEECHLWLLTLYYRSKSGTYCIRPSENITNWLGKWKEVILVVKNVIMTFFKIEPLSRSKFQLVTVGQKGRNNDSAIFSGPR